MPGVREPEELGGAAGQLQGVGQRRLRADGGQTLRAEPQPLREAAEGGRLPAVSVWRPPIFFLSFSFWAMGSKSGISVSPPVDTSDSIQALK